LPAAFKGSIACGVPASFLAATVQLPAAFKVELPAAFNIQYSRVQRFNCLRRLRFNCLRRSCFVPRSDGSIACGVPASFLAATVQ